MLTAALVGRKRGTRAVRLPAIHEFDAQRTTAARQPIHIDAGRDEQSRGRRWIDKQINRLTPGPQQFSNFWVFHPQKALRLHEFGSTDNRTRLLQHTSDGIGKRSNDLESRTERIRFYSRA